MPISRRTLLAGGSLAIVGLASNAAAKAPSDTSLNFITVGDWGKSNEPRQREVAMSMGRTAREFDCRFVISTGDNFYAQGVSSVNDMLWQTAYEQVYTDAALFCPWYPVLGNHDHRGNTQAQIDYSKISSRWSMPSSYYRRTELIGASPLLEMFFLDTLPLTDDTTITRIRNSFGVDGGDDQYKWLEAGLRASHAKWKIVVGHHPIHSGGPHKISDLLRVKFKPLLRTHGVIAYFNGHDHNLQHITADQTHFLTCGSGSQAAQPRIVEGTQFSSDAIGYLRCELTRSRFGIEFFAADGQSLYRSDLAK